MLALQITAALLATIIGTAAVHGQTSSGAGSAGGAGGASGTAGSSGAPAATQGAPATSPSAPANAPYQGQSGVTSPNSNAITRGGNNTLPASGSGNQGSSGAIGQQPSGTSAATVPQTNRASDVLSRDSGSAIEKSIIHPSDTEARNTGTTSRSSN
ncbi:hypothetical protein FHS85_001835 [Rhodoligotrophos appendicifer]|uniref:hypothetical protein n=1 Tax=Rhodoligotrophos appendicifer TaxID=987056 RepID=UPI0011859F7F|nr:hypothetical protein [Rhodoligotrophos appendicifer]